MVQENDFIKEQLGLSVINETLNESQLNVIAADLQSHQTFMREAEDSAMKIRQFMEKTDNFFNRSKPTDSIFLKVQEPQQLRINEGNGGEVCEQSPIVASS